MKQDAGNAVKTAAQHLVEAAQTAAKVATEMEEVNVALGSKTTDQIKAELEAQAFILQKERELENARIRLGKIREKKYGKGGAPP